MALVSTETFEVEIPHEPGETMNLRAVAWITLAAAEEARAERQLASAHAVGGDLMKAMDEISRRRKEEEGEGAGPTLAEIISAAAEEEESDPWDPDGFDTEIILIAGIAGWSYKTKCNRNAIRSLDRETADWAKAEILERSKPRGEAEKKDS